MKTTKYLIKNDNGRYLGNSVWTFDIDRAIHFPSKKDADNAAKGYINVSVIVATNQ